jgi:hypothetical protein
MNSSGGRPGLRGAGLGGLVVATVVVVGALVLRGGVSPAGTSSSQPVPSASVGASDDVPAASPSPVPTPGPTPLPSAVITGVLPGPDATSPAGQPLLSGVGVWSVASAAAAFGIACESASGSYPGATGGFTMTCTGLDATGTARLTVSAVFTTLNEVVSVSAQVDPEPFDGTITDVEIAPSLLVPFADLVAGSEGSGWLQSKMNDGACSQGCLTTIGATRFELHVGADGSRSLDVTPASMP